MSDVNARSCFQTYRTTVIGISMIYILLRFIIRDEPIYHIIPNLLMFTPINGCDEDKFSCTYGTEKLWRDPTSYLPMHTEHKHIAEIDASDYSFETLGEVSQNWRVPVVIRGLFTDTIAVKKWKNKHYLPNQIGAYDISVAREAYPLNQNDRYVTTFAKAWKELRGNAKSAIAMIFPLISRSQFTNASETEKLKDIVNDLVGSDMELERIQNGFGTEKKKMYSMQLNIAGGGDSNHLNNYTGLAWHAEPGSNWFAMVHGSKTWYFAAPRDSSLFIPFRESLNSVSTSDQRLMDQVHHRLPLHYVHLQEGDLLYNPDWQWHHTRNGPGVSIGVAMRDVNFYYSFRNNPFFFLLFLRNHGVDQVFRLFQKTFS